jgi:hypothetical protein
MRPAVLLIAARLSGYTGDRSVLYAAVVEFITPLRSSTTTSSAIRICAGRLTLHSLGQRRHGAARRLSHQVDGAALTHDTLDIVRLRAMSRCG